MIVHLACQASADAEALCPHRPGGLFWQACVKEVLRLYPAIPVFPREAVADDTLPSGHPISRGRAAGAAGHLTLL